MDPLLVLFGGLVVFLLLFALALGIWHPKSGTDIVGRSLRSPDAEAEIEATDIDQMIAARNEIRRRHGRPELGDDLVAELRRELDQG